MQAARPPPLSSRHGVEKLSQYARYQLRNTNCGAPSAPPYSPPFDSPIFSRLSSGIGSFLYSPLCFLILLPPSSIESRQSPCPSLNPFQRRTPKHRQKN